MAPPRNLDLNTLECFDMLLRERSVSRAAQRLDLSQSSMSEALARLRERFGDPLLVRTRDGMVATAAAQELLPKVRAAIDQLRGLLQGAGPFDPSQARDAFRITATDYAQLLFAAGLARRLQAAAPGCKADWVTINLRHLEIALEAGDTDLAIAFYPEPPLGLRRSPLFSDRYVCALRRGHPQTPRIDGGPMAADQFAALSHVSVSPSGLSYFANVVDTALATAGLSRHIAVTCPHFLIAAHLVSQTDLALALPSRAAYAVARYFPIETVDIALPMKMADVSLFWHERSQHSPSHQWLRESLKALAIEAEAPATAREKT